MSIRPLLVTFQSERAPSFTGSSLTCNHRNVKWTLMVIWRDSLLPESSGSLSLSFSPCVFLPLALSGFCLFVCVLCLSIFVRENSLGVVTWQQNGHMLSDGILWRTFNASLYCEVRWQPAQHFHSITTEHLRTWDDLYSQSIPVDFCYRETIIL